MEHPREEIAIPEEGEQLRWYQFSLAGFLTFTFFAAIWCRLLTQLLWYGLAPLFIGYPIGVIAAFVYVREVTRHEGKTLTQRALVACGGIACALRMFCVDWPLRSVAVDLDGCLEFHYPGKMFDWTLFIFLLISAGGFQAILWAKRFSLVRRNRFAPGALCALLVIVVFCCCADYPKVRGLLQYHRISHDPARLTVKYEVVVGCGGSPHLFIFVTEGSGPFIEEAKATNQRDEPARVVVISRSEMRNILRLLREERFFEMDWCLYPFGTIDGTWKSLSISDGQHEHIVHSWAGRRSDEPFARVMRRLHGELPVEVPELLELNEPVDHRQIELASLRKFVKRLCWGK